MTASPTWFNSQLSDAITPEGTQHGSTCGLHAFNHAMVSASAIAHLPHAPVPKAAFESTAMAAHIGDAPRNLMDPGGSFYDVAVLNANFSAAGVTSFPMTPMDVQHKLGDVFGPHSIPEGEFRTAGYLLRTPSSGGHWITVIDARHVPYLHATRPPAFLCDSLYSTAHAITLQQTEDLLYVCAWEHAQRTSAQEFCPWHCFLVGVRIAE